MSSQPDHYYTIDKPSFAEFKDRGSRFLAYAYPLGSTDEFKKQLQQLKKEHPKAVHHCFAYRLGTAMNNFRSNDDGEPSGTAGKPILGQIDSKQLTDVAVIVVRYFGGTLLGVPGLINAYKTAAAMALQLVPVVQKPVLIHYRLQFDYTRQNEVMTILKQLNCVITRQAQELFCIMEVGVPQARLEEFEYRLRDLHTVEYDQSVRPFP
jgi:uncharacterized YigZ family protein